MIRIQQGMHGPVLLLPEDSDIRTELDDYEFEISEDLMLSIRKNGKHVNAMFLGRGD